MCWSYIYILAWRLLIFFFADYNLHKANRIDSRLFKNEEDDTVCTETVTSPSLNILGTQMTLSNLIQLKSWP